MKTLNPDSPQILRQEIAAEAQLQSKEIAHRAQQEVETVLRKACPHADDIERQLRAEADAEGERRAGLVLATVPVEAGRLRLECVEAVLESLLQEARHKLSVQDGFDYRKAVVALAVEAIRHMAGNRFVVRLSVADHAVLGKGLAEEIARGADRTDSIISPIGDPAVKGGGVIVQDEAGRQIWDNQLVSRLERVWPELRRQVAIQTGMVGMLGAAGGVT
ncbi:MAG TPA: V-type ATP synthase subunit E family protein [Verrucomicrobiae bacterium]|nr:V-type ATP synthase subunit E family protein [Verrucomicrobiae bacterium]